MTMQDNLLPSGFTTHGNEEERVLHYGDPLAELEALRQLRGFHLGQPQRVLRIEGEDRIELLQRISAGDLAAVGEGAVCPLPFTDAKGKLVDKPWVKVNQDHLLAICGPGRRERLKEWIQSYTILEDVVCAAEESWVVVDRSADAPPYLFEELEARAGIETLIAEGNHPVGDLAYAQWCAEELKLRPGLDLDERFNPLEAGLRRDIAFDKGCYIGQEVVARLENYDKVRRRPALLHGASPLAQDAELSHAAKRGAQVVHSAERLDADGAYALALLERGIEEGAALLAEDGAQWTVVKVAQAL